MSTIENRLRSDATSVTAEPDWDAVVGRADIRVERQRTLFRTTVAAIAALVAVGWLLAGDGRSVLAPELLQPTSTPAQRVDPWSEPSPIWIMAAYVAVWGGSLLAGSVTFYASARHFRAPYLFARLPRAMAVASAVLVWNAVLLLAVSILGFVEQGIFLTTAYPEARSAFLLSFVWVGALLYLSSTGGAGKSVVYAVGFLLMSSLVVALLPSSPELAARAITVVVLVTGLVLSTFRPLAFEIDRSRLHHSSVWALKWRDVTGAVLVVGGLILALVAMAPTVVFTTQLGEIASPVNGLHLEEHGDSHPLLEGADPTLNVSYGSQDVIDDFDFGEYLEADGFERVLVGDGYVEYRRPRGDGFGATIVRLESIPVSTGILASLSAESNRPFQIGRTARNLGYSLAIAGLLLWWSGTALSRFEGVSPPWRRRGGVRERLGWAAVLASGALPFGLVASDSFSSGLPLSVVLWLIGANLMAPLPPEQPLTP